MKIVCATREHIPGIIFLNAFVHEIHRSEHPDHFKSIKDINKDATRFFKGILSKENHYVFVAYENEKPVGYLWVALDVISENPFRQARNQLYVHQIVVHKDHRRQSIGTALFAEAENMAEHKAIKHFEVDTWAFNSEARAFFKKLGFETFNVRMWRNTGK